jgi:hypothetical protein
LVAAERRRAPAPGRRDSGRSAASTVESCAGRPTAASRSTGSPTYRGNAEEKVVWPAQLPDDAEVTVAGDAAVLNAVVVDELEQDSRRIPNRLRLIRTSVRDGDGWSASPRKRA